MMVDFVLYPLDTIKTRLQTKTPAGKKVSKTNFYSGTQDPSAEIVAETDFRVLRKLRFSCTGLLSAMLGSFPGAATFWTAYSVSQKSLTSAFGGNGEAAAGVVNGIAAGLADVAVVAVRNPFEVIKQQTQAGLHKSSVEAFRYVIRHEGIAGLYAGTVKRLGAPCAMRH